MATATTASEPAAAAAGRRILHEIEETSLEDVLQRIRGQVQQQQQQQIPASLPDVAPSALPPTQPLTSRPGTAAAAAAAAATTPAAAFPIPALDALVARHFRATRAPELVIGGPHTLPLLYLLVAALVGGGTRRRQAVVVVDCEARFDPRQLLGLQASVVRQDGHDDDDNSNDDNDNDGTWRSGCVTRDDLQHVHVFRVDPRWTAPGLPALVSAAAQQVLYGAQRQRDRACWGTLVIGGGGLGGAAAGGAGGTSAASHPTTGAVVTTGYYGWLRVDAQQQQRPSSAQTGSRQPITWVASSPWGGFAFQLQKESA